MAFRSEEFKAAAVQKYYQRGARPVKEVARELGVANSQLYAWASRYGTQAVMKHRSTEPRRPQDFTPPPKSYKQ